VQMKDVIGKPDWFALPLTGEETPDRLICISSNLT
jgi:hypothetical protein